MEALENMVNAIIEDGEKEIAAYLKERKALEEKFERKKAAIDRDTENQKEQVRSKLDKNFRQMAARERLNYRERIMNEKMDYLNQVFDEALHTLNNWTREEVQAFFISILNRFPEGNYRILVGERSRDYLTDSFMNSLNDGKKYVIADNIIAKKGGFILEQADQIQFDYLFDNVIFVLKEKYLFQVSEILFR